MTPYAPDPDAPSPRRTAVVDLGSNTFRLVVFEQTGAGGHRLVDEFRETVRLSAGITSGRLTDKAVERAVRTAAAYARFCRAAGIEDIVALATSAIREAENGDEVLEAIREAGLRARVVDAREEARLGYLGAVNSTTLVDGHVLDIGGGSAQIVRVQGRRMVASLSEPLGAVRMTEKFFTDGRIGNGRQAKLEKHVRSALADHDWIESGDRLIGLGGSVRTLASMAGRYAGDPLRMVHGSRLTMAQLEALIEDMAAVEPEKRGRIAGLKRDRADILPAAAIVLRTILEVLEVDRLEISGHGLREGAFWDHLHPDEPLIDGVRRHWVENLAVVHGADRAHAERVARLAGQIYEGVAAGGLQEADDQERSLLWAAAQLHDIGTSIDYHDHHKHSQYLVMNAGLPGHDPRELTLVGRLVRGHRKRLPSASDGDHHMRSGDPEMVQRLLVCLRIAEQLERDRAGTISAVDVRVKKKELHLAVHTNGDASLAIWAAERETDTTEKVFGRSLHLSAS